MGRFIFYDLEVMWGFLGDLWDIMGGGCGGYVFDEWGGVY